MHKRCTYLPYTILRWIRRLYCCHCHRHYTPAKTYSVPNCTLGMGTLQDRCYSSQIKRHQAPIYAIQALIRSLARGWNHSEPLTYKSWPPVSTIMSSVWLPRVTSIYHISELPMRLDSSTLGSILRAARLERGRRRRGNVMAEALVSSLLSVGSKALLSSTANRMKGTHMGLNILDPIRFSAETLMLVWSKTKDT